MSKRNKSSGRTFSRIVSGWSWRDATYTEPLRQVGTVEADDIELARVYAQSIYDEFAWIEMVLVPRETMVTVIAS